VCYSYLLYFQRALSMIVLGIETTCDETAVSIVRGGKEILSNVIASQAEGHRKFGGVFPEVASRSHIEALPWVMRQALEEANLSKEAIDLISVAKGPGLIGPLLIGLNAAKAFSMALEKPFIGVNHVEAHLYAAMMHQEDPIFPSLGIVLSGGHTFLVLIHGLGSYEKIGTTVDDAVGEAFDKVARLLDLPYPGGPEIEKLALNGSPALSFKSGRVKERPYDFSFSGLKTNVFYSIYGQNGTKKTACPLSDQQKADVAFAFQEAALQDVVSKAQQAVQDFGCKAVYIGGGVSCNRRLRTLFQEKQPSLPVFWPPLGLCMDNAAMIAGLGFHVYQRQGKGDELDLEPLTRIPLA
jgi:N6-L-threonylcarbamoyladenine synthase